MGAAEELTSLKEDRFGKDQVFADALARRATIISSAPTDQSIEGLGPHVGTATVGGNPFDYVNSWSGILPPVTILAEASSGVGVSSTIGDVDGTIRKLPMVVGANEQIYPSVALETIRVAAGDISYQMKVGEAGVEAVRIPKFEPIKTTADGSVYISYWNKFDSISAADITPENTAGKFLIWGVTAEGVANPVPTSVGSMYPHEVQANLLQTVLNGNTIVRPDYADFLELVIILFVGLLIILAVYKAPMKLVLPLVILIAGGFGYASYHYWKTEYLLLDASLPVLGMLVIFAHASFAKFLENFLLKQQIKKQFGTYLSPAMVEKLQENPDLLQLGGESRELSIMFTDVRGFTTISEHYGKDVQGLTKIMNRYMTAMTQKIIENEGTLDKYIGDAQMAFWNAPLDDAEHAKNALRTGLAMLGDLEKFNEEISKEGIPAFGMGLGINTDVVVVGNMGSVQRFDYTCLGDGVNLAARLEGQVNLDDLLTSTAGGVVRLKNPNALVPLTVAPTTSGSFPMLEYLDGVQARRTGVSDSQNGIDPNILQNVTAAAVSAMSQASAGKLELIARIFAETGVKSLFKGILSLLCKYEDKEKLVRINGKYVSFNPREWNNQYNVSINVGLGTGTRQEQLTTMQMILQKQEQIIQQYGLSNPLVNLMQYRNTLAKFINMAGFKDAAQFMNEITPEQNEALSQPQPEKLDPNTEAAKVLAEVEREKAVIRAQTEAAKLELEREQMQLDNARKALELQQQELKQNTELALKQLKIEADAANQAEQTRGANTKSIVEALNTINNMTQGNNNVQ